MEGCTRKVQWQLGILAAILTFAWTKPKIKKTNRWWDGRPVLMSTASSPANSIWKSPEVSLTSVYVLACVYACAVALLIIRVICDIQTGKSSIMINNSTFSKIPLYVLLPLCFSPLSAACCMLHAAFCMLYAAVSAPCGLSVWLSWMLSVHRSCGMSADVAAWN